MLLGSETFVDALRPYIQDAEKLDEVPRAQRLLNRPTLPDLFKRKKKLIKAERDDKIRTAHLQYGYTLAEIGRFLELHYSTISRVVSGDR